MTKMIPIKDLEESARISEMCHSTEEPIFITKNGNNDMVIMSIETFDKYRRSMQLQPFYHDLCLAEKDFQAGSIIDAYESLDEIMTTRKTGGLL